jgi:DNA-binding Lrp family transcriptional regulator
MRNKLDRIDYRILHTCRNIPVSRRFHSRTKWGLSPTPCLRRLNGLESAGVIRKYVTLINPNAVNLAVTVFVQISLDLRVEGRLEIFEKFIMNRPEVLECYLMAGHPDFLLAQSVCAARPRRAGGATGVQARVCECPSTQSAATCSCCWICERRSFSKLSENRRISAFAELSICSTQRTSGRATTDMVAVWLPAASRLYPALGIGFRLSSTLGLKCREH